MSEIPIRIDGKDVVARQGMTVLDAARGAGIGIPTLCHQEKLAPYGGCRLCLVEAEIRGREQIVAACVFPVEPGMVVTTRSEKVERIRRTLVELLLARAPDSPPLRELAASLGASRDGFEPDASFCVHCGLCVRYCDEVKGLHAVGFVDRGPKKEISFVPGIAKEHCRACMECFPLCPTSYLQAAFVLTEAMISPCDKGAPTTGEQ